MVDAGAASHIINDIQKFISFDSTFQPESHSVELADGTRCTGMAQQRGTVVIYLLDNQGQQHRAQLREALYMPSYPQEIFSVARAAHGGATITFQQGNCHVMDKDGLRTTGNSSSLLVSMEEDACSPSLGTCSKSFLFFSGMGEHSPWSFRFCPLTMQASSFNITEGMGSSMTLLLFTGASFSSLAFLLDIVIFVYCLCVHV